MNAAGLRAKLLTFKKVIHELKPSVFFLEETKFRDCGNWKLDNYIIYELVRESRDGGGGLALGVSKELHPAWVREGDDTVEALSVEISLKNMKIRCCVAYGCQENDLVERKEAFWKYLDEEVNFADESGAGFVMHFDGNLWAGEDLVPGDPRPQNRNGRLFKEFLNRHPHLSIVNALPVCEGLITRRRVRDGKLEESVLDFFVICSRMLPYLTKMVVDVSNNYILTNYQQVKRGGKAVDSDHATEYMDMDIEIESEKPERIEMYNFKNTEAQMKFLELTSETNEFTKCFENKMPVLKQVDKWLEMLNSYCAKSFKKIRIRSKNVKPLKAPLVKLINQRNVLINRNEGIVNTIELEGVTKRIAELEAEENRNKIFQHFKFYSDNPEQINMQQMWKLMKQMWPKVGLTLPVAKKNHKGKIVSGPMEIKKLLAREYKDRLRSRPVRPDLKNMKVRRKIIFKLKMKLASMKQSPDWSMADLDLALSNLKNNKSRDPNGYINEIFKDGVIGENLKKSLLLMMNKLKKGKLIPKVMNVANVTTVPKKGSRILLKNERGIFRVSVLRFILMRLIYNIKYPTIDKNMSDCQMGARKKKGCKNNIFIINGIIHDVLKSKKMKPILLQIYDYAQMFDSIDLQEAIIDIYNAGVDDDNLILLQKANAEIKMAVKTPNGLTERQTIRNIVLQGDTWGSILASNQVDSIGKECMEAGHYYLYKDVLPVGFLGLVDNIINYYGSWF